MRMADEGQRNAGAPQRFDETELILVRLETPSVNNTGARVDAGREREDRGDPPHWGRRASAWSPEILLDLPLLAF
jgi:hypothetical protein